MGKTFALANESLIVRRDCLQRSFRLQQLYSPGDLIAVSAYTDDLMRS